MITVTTSWDDGDVLDMKLATLLDTYGIKGTFYVAQTYRENRLSEEQIRQISKTHEIGAHTLTHPDLATIPLESVRKEIGGSKQWLESVCGKSIDMFCYPKGRHNDEVCAIVRESGYIGARTVMQTGLELPIDPFRMGTTVQLYPYPFRRRSANKMYWSRFYQPFFERNAGFRKLGVPFSKLFSWESAVCAAFDASVKKGGIFHLWGHSWEIEHYGMWDALERVLAHIAHTPDCRHMTNGEIIRGQSFKHI